MAIPAQVRKQSEAVQKLYDDLNEDVTEQDVVSEAVVENIKPDPVEDTDSVEQQAVESTNNEQVKVDDVDEEETFEKRRLHAEKRELESRVSQLETLMTTLSEPNVASTTAAQVLVTDADVEEYGESIDVMRRVSREEAASQQSRIDQLENLVRGMQTSVVPQVQQLQHRQAVTTEQAFWADIQTAVPDWQEVNTDPEFQSWLLDVDPLTGISRQTYLDDAQRNLDSRRVTNFFSTWKTQTGQSVAQPSRQATANSQLEKQVAPGRGRSSATKNSGEPATYSSNDIKKFFSDVQKGKYKGKEQERDRKELTGR